MSRLRVVACLALGVLLFAAMPLAIYWLQPPALVRFAADPPAQIAQGFYAAEHTPAGQWYAWTRGTFGLTFPGLDRRGDWTVTLRVAADHPDGAAPELATSVDGGAGARIRLPASGFVEQSVQVPARQDGSRGATLTFAVSPTFNPGPSDPRDLGVKVTWIRLARTAGRVPLLAQHALPPILPGALAGAVMGALLPPITAGILLAALAGGAGVVLTHGLGPFADVPWMWIMWPAIGAALAAAACLPLASRGARIVAAITFAVVELELLVLAHPDMPIGDALFHTHRFQAVLGGSYLFTSIAPGNYRFPYPVGLYVFAGLFSRLARSAPDRMALLRALVVGVDALAAALLYRLVSWWRRDELAAVAAVVAYQLLPLRFGVMTTGNLTNAFANSLAVLTLLATARLVAVDGRPDGRAAHAAGRAGLAAGVAVLAAAAFLSHTSTFAVLSTQLALAGGALWLARDAAWRRGGRLLLAAAAAAFVVAVALYYVHFMDVYREALTRVVAETGQATPAAGGRTPLTRLLDVPRELVAAYTIPGILLAVVGGVFLSRDRARSPVWTVTAMWLAACGLFLVIGIVTPVDMRHDLAALPAVAVLAAVGFTHAWRAGGSARIAAGAGAAWMAWMAAANWLRPLG